MVPLMVFDNRAEEAVRYYIGIFKNSKIGEIQRYAELGPGPEGSVMFMTFQLNGEEFCALNAGPQVAALQAPTFFVTCRTQEEIDDLWEKLSDAGKKLECGWLVDKYGVTWNIVPTVLTEMMLDMDKEKPQRVFKAVLQMQKLEIKLLQQAFEGKETVKTGV
jgi:predicted 3-demethylubiquinone-9 3-methyltransferase (glyoxalase superfamily)